MPNVFNELKALLAPGRVQVGTVTAIAGNVATVTLPGGGKLRAKGQASVGAKVFVQEGVIQGPAPDLAVVVDVI